MQKKTSTNNFLDEIDSKIFAEADRLFFKMPNYLAVRAYLRVRIAFLKREQFLENNTEKDAPAAHIHQQKQVILHTRQEGEQSSSDVTSGEEV